MGPVLSARKKASFLYFSFALCNETTQASNFHGTNSSRCVASLFLAEALPMPCQSELRSHQASFDRLLWRRRVPIRACRFRGMCFGPPVQFSSTTRARRIRLKNGKDGMRLRMWLRLTGNAVSPSSLSIGEPIRRLSAHGLASKFPPVNCGACFCRISLAGSEFWSRTDSAESARSSRPEEQL